MKTLLAAIAAVLLVAGTSQAQCGQTKVFVTNSGFQNSRVVFNGSNYGHNNAAVVVKQTGFADVAAVNGVVVVPAQVNNGYGHHNAAVIVPQSTFFFAGSNPNVFEFRTREFLQVPGTNQIITSDSFGNEVILNAGVRGSNTVIRSRGQQIFQR